MATIWATLMEIGLLFIPTSGHTALNPNVFMHWSGWENASVRVRVKNSNVYALKSEFSLQRTLK